MVIVCQPVGRRGRVVDGRLEFNEACVSAPAAPIPTHLWQGWPEMHWTSPVWCTGAWGCLYDSGPVCGGVPTC